MLLKSIAFVKFGLLDATLFAVFTSMSLHKRELLPEIMRTSFKQVFLLVSLLSFLIDISTVYNSRHRGDFPTCRQQGHP